MIEEIQRVRDHINAGRVILYPTDTIWGIGCDATDPVAVQKIYEIKQRSDQKSMLVLMDSYSMLNQYLEEIPFGAQEFIRSLEKPTTIIYPKAKNLAKNLTGEDGSIGIRITSDSFCQKLIQATGKPIVSTSANISGYAAPVTFKEIDQIILGQADYIVEWRRDDSAVTSASSIVKLEKDGSIIVLRP